jgi:hypothetical protein
MHFQSKHQWHSSLNKKNPKIHEEAQKKPWIAKVILGRKNNAGGIMIPDFNTYYRVIVTNTTYREHKNKNIEKWNRT